MFFRMVLTSDKFFKFFCVWEGIEAPYFDFCEARSLNYGENDALDKFLFVDLDLRSEAMKPFSEIYSYR